MKKQVEKKAWIRCRKSIIRTVRGSVDVHLSQNYIIEQADRGPCSSRFWNITCNVLKGNRNEEIYHILPHMDKEMSWEVELVTCFWNIVLTPFSGNLENMAYVPGTP